jgi:broad specificity phosphatase PhoE
VTRLTFVRHGQSVTNAGGVTMDDPALAAGRAGARDLHVISVKC